jgi:aarF domain-containing kinase
MVATFVMRQLQVVLLVLSFTSYSNSFVRNVATVSRSSAGLQNLKMVATASMSDVSAQMRDMREAMRADEKTALMMDALRGKNLNDDDRQGDGIDMQVVRMRAADDVNDVLPTVYNPARLEAYFSKRPGAVFTRVWQVAYASSSFLSGVLFDYITGSTDDVEVKRAAQLRNTIVSLGPFFIKLGQALSIRPDILSPRAMVELQQLCDKVPCFDSALAMRTIEEELGRRPSEIFSKMTAEPVAAASLGQVYKATLAETGEEVAVKVQRPFVLETVSLDLHLVRNIGLFLRKFPTIASRLDIVSILDEFANNFYQELDYNLECQNGIRVAEDMKRLPMVVIPKNYPTYTARRYVVQLRLIHFFLLFTDPIFLRQSHLSSPLPRIFPLSPPPPIHPPLPHYPFTSTNLTNT